ncbi:MAG: hypothetical protein ACRC5C_14180 [Bacilli bacterium]
MKRKIILILLTIILLQACQQKEEVNIRLKEINLQNAVANTIITIDSCTKKASYTIIVNYLDKLASEGDSLRVVWENEELALSSAPTIVSKNEDSVRLQGTFDFASSPPSMIKKFRVLIDLLDDKNYLLEQHTVYKAT